MKLKSSESHSMPTVNSPEGKKTLENDAGTKYLLIRTAVVVSLEIRKKRVVNCKGR